MKMAFTFWASVLVLVFLAGASGSLLRVPEQGTIPSVISQGETPRTSGLIVVSPISISGDAGWATCPWVNGSGTWGDPYTISNLLINGTSSNYCIIISETQKPFRIANCTLLDASSSYSGIGLWDVGNGTLTNNSCIGSGIYLRYSINNTLANNTCTGNLNYGIDLYFSSNNTLSQNTLTSCSIIIDGTLSTILSNVISSDNTVNGRPVYFYTNQVGVSVPTDSGQVILANCSSTTIANFQSASVTIELCYSSNNTIQSNMCTQGSVGIDLVGSSNNTLASNTCTENDLVAIKLLDSTNITLAGNTCASNNVPFAGGILVDSSSNCTLTGNNCPGNFYGIVLQNSGNNILSGNNCTGNGGDGIYLGSASNNTLAGNNCTGNNDNGIALSDSSNYNTLATNTCLNNTRWGVYLDGSCFSNIGDNLPAAAVLSAITPNPSSTGTITLVWNAVAGATFYQVYRDLDYFFNVNGLTAIATVTTSTYQDNNLTSGTYYYIIVAVNAVNNAATSNCVNITVAIPSTTPSGISGAAPTMVLGFSSFAVLGLVRRMRAKHVAQFELSV